MEKIIFVIIISLLSMQACKKEVDIDAIIKRVDNTDISLLEGLIVGARGVGDIKSRYYLVGKVGENSPPYGVTVTKKNWNEMTVHRHMLEIQDKEDYLDEDIIRKAVLLYLELKLYCIIVLEDGEVVIPLNEGRSIELLRKSSHPSEERAYDGYEPYKGDWYLKNRYNN